MQPLFYIYLVVFVFEEARQRLHTGLQRRVLGLHFAAKAGHNSHGWVQSVFMNKVPTVSDETQHTVQPACLKHCARLSGTDQLQHLEKHENICSNLISRRNM